MAAQAVVLTAYLICLLPLAIFGLHRLALVWLRARPDPELAPDDPDIWPVVTVQVPLYNERYVARRVIEAVAALDYPRDRLEVQVLDDSTDDTTAVVDRVVGRLEAGGVPITAIRRADRKGFKAGALEHGLSSARGSLVAVFDADFVPQPDFLRRVVPWFHDGVGMVQARWGHLNPRDSWLTAGQATLLDGHFVVEHAARYRSGRWFNFNGTAGVWRRQAIEDAGGWQHDTLTEDLDLSYRAQLAGWRFVYLDGLVVPAELPATMGAFKSQQNRWARGGMQTARKLLGPVWRSDSPLAVKVEASLHLLANLAYPLLVLLSLLLPPAVWARTTGATAALLGIDLVLFVAAFASVCLFYGVAVWNAGAPGVWRRLAGLAVPLALGLGMALSQSVAAWKGLTGGIGVFVRTPKRGGSAATRYRSRVAGVVVFELLMALWQIGGLCWAMANGWWASVPFMALFAGGYSAVAVRTLVDAGRQRRAADVGEVAVGRRASRAG